jgi:hypothetical protein
MLLIRLGLQGQSLRLEERFCPFAGMYVRFRTPPPDFSVTAHEVILLPTIHVPYRGGQGFDSSVLQAQADTASAANIGINAIDP